MFIYPFNGRTPNDIEKRRPGTLAIFESIAENAKFAGVLSGTSKDVLGYTIGGDADDWALDKFGILSVTYEIGMVG